MKSNAFSALAGYDDAETYTDVVHRCSSPTSTMCMLPQHIVQDISLAKKVAAVPPSRYKEQ